MKATFWQEMRDEGFILVDAPSRKVAVFPNQSGEVVLASLEDSTTHICMIEPDEIGEIVAALITAKLDANAILDAIEPAYEAHVAISKAMGVV